MSAPMITVERRPVDWFRIIVDLERRGYTHTTLAKQLHPIHRATVGKWRCRTSEPAHANGEALIALWMVVTGSERTALPRRRDMQLSAARVK